MNQFKILFFLLFPFACVFGQRDSSFVAWIEKESVDGKVVISCWAENKTSASTQLRYKAVLIKDGVPDVRESTTLALPGQATLLLKAVFAVPDGIFEKVSVDVFKDETLVASTSLLGKKTDTPLPLAQNSTPANAETDSPLHDEIEIEGLILDETRSKLAHDFYELFYGKWSANDSLSGAYTITIREQPIRIGIGTRISVEVDGQELTQLNLQPRLDILEDFAGQLVEALINYLQNPENAIPELEAEEMQGTGIY